MGSANFVVFREPRGFMRVLQFVFAIVSFCAITRFEGYVEVNYCTDASTSASTSQVAHLSYSYPFDLSSVKVTAHCEKETGDNHYIYLIGDFSSDAEFFVITCILSVLYTIGIAFVYVKLSDLYEKNGKLALIVTHKITDNLAHSVSELSEEGEHHSETSSECINQDFICSVVLAVFWLSGSAAWAYGLSKLKSLTEPTTLKASMNYCVPKNPEYLGCGTIIAGGYFGLNMSMITGFLNFFLWASDLWFLYKETPWFHTHQGVGYPA